MQVHHFHPWNVTPKEAIQIQQLLRAKVIPQGKVATPSLIAGADVAFVGDIAHACVVVLTFPKLEIVGSVVHKEKVTFPDFIFVDGQGLAHPRAAGIACHIGVLLDRPSIGCAKSLLFGTYEGPKQVRGSVSDLFDGEGQVIGAVVRTRDGIQPVFVSGGRKIDLAQAIELTLACGKGYRVPEPTRQADFLSERAKQGGGLGDAQAGQYDLFG